MNLLQLTNELQTLSRAQPARLLLSCIGLRYTAQILIDKETIASATGSDSEWTVERALNLARYNLERRKTA